MDITLEDNNNNNHDYDSEKGCVSEPGQVVASAICLKKHISKYSKKVFPFSISWDNPVARFGSGYGVYRYYTQFFGKSGLNSSSMAAYGLLHVRQWEKDIIQWQKSIFDKEELPSYYKHLLFNELYFLVDGGSIWSISDTNCSNDNYSLNSGRDHSSY